MCILIPYTYSLGSYRARCGLWFAQYRGSIGMQLAHFLLKHSMISLISVFQYFDIYLDAFLSYYSSTTVLPTNFLNSLFVLMERLPASLSNFLKFTNARKVYLTDVNDDTLKNAQFNVDLNRLSKLYFLNYRFLYFQSHRP